MDLDSPKLRELEARMQRAQAQSVAQHERAKRGLDKIKQTVTINTEQNEKDTQSDRAIRPTVWLDKSKLPIAEADEDEEEEDEESDGEEE